MVAHGSMLFVLMCALSGQDEIRTFMEGYPGDLYEEPFVDFSTTRNFALRVWQPSSVGPIGINGSDSRHCMMLL